MRGSHPTSLSQELAATYDGDRAGESTVATPITAHSSSPAPRDRCSWPGSAPRWRAPPGATATP